MTYIKDSQPKPSEQAQNDPNSELYEEYLYDGTYEDELEVLEPSEYGMDGELPPEAAKPLSAAEIRSKLDELLQSQQISEADYKMYVGKLNHSVSLSPAQREQILLSIASEVFPMEAPADVSGGDSFSAAEDVTSKQITDLMENIKSGQVKPIDGEISSEQCVTILKQALKDENSNQGNRAAEEFMQVLDAVGGPEAIDPKNIAAQKLGEMPASVDKDEIHFDESGATLNLKAPGDDSEVTVDNASSVTLTPKNSSDEVKISEEGDYYVVEMGDDTFKVNKDAKLTILSDHVSGDVANEDGNIKVGANSSSAENYLSPEKLKELSGKISSGAQEVESNKPLKYPEDSDRAAKILKDMAAALAETDPKKREEAWESVADELNRLGSQPADGEDNWAAYANDIAQLVFNVLYDKLGESGLKDALTQGIIPSDIATSLSARLTMKTDENTSGDYKNAGGGGPGWTHQSSADFLTKYSTSSSTSA